MLFRCFSSSVWHVTPLLILGQLKLYFNNLTMKYTLKSGVGVSDWCYWSECSPNGGIQWVLRKPRTSSIGRCVQYSTAASRWPSKWSAKWTHFASSFCLLLPWRPPGRYGASSHLMVAFSGFYESTGPPPSVDVRGIAPSHRHGYRNGLWWRCFCSLSPNFLPGIIVAKNHVMVHIN
jgi:hypothetical protein